MSAPMGPPPKTRTASPLFTFARADGVGRDGERLDHGGVVVRERGRHLDEALGRHRPVLLHAAGQLHAAHLELVAEIGRAHPAGAAGVAEAERLDHDVIARGEAAAGRRLRDLGEGLVADDAALGHAVVEVPLEDVQVRAADADAPDLEQRLTRRGLGSGAVPVLKRPAPS